MTLTKDNPTVRTGRRRALAWEEEFGPDYAVPQEIEDLVRLGALVDASWHNDVAPRFEQPCPQGHVGPVRVAWIDHPCPDQRETGRETPRFVVQAWHRNADGTVEDAGTAPLYAGDSVLDALAAMGVGPAASDHCTIRLGHDRLRIARHGATRLTVDYGLARGIETFDDLALARHKLAAWIDRETREAQHRLAGLRKALLWVQTYLPPKPP